MLFLLSLKYTYNLILDVQRRLFMASIDKYFKICSAIIYIVNEAIIIEVYVLFNFKMLAVVQWISAWDEKLECRVRIADRSVYTLTHIPLAKV